MSTIYDYDRPSREALVRLIDYLHPRLGVHENNVDFDPPFFSPTVNEPGRTFIEVYLLDKGQKTWFAYRRLDMAQAIGNPVSVYVDGSITSKKIVDAVNAKFGFVMDQTDTDYTDREIAPTGTAIYYRLEAKPESYVWYGETVVEVLPATATTDSRLLEDGSPRLMEDGDPRLLESA